MTQSINTALVTQFSDAVHVNAQQMQMRMQDSVVRKMVKGEDYAYETLSDLEAIEITSRHQNTVGQDITHGRRRIRMREFRATIYLDEKDELEVLIDPQREYAQAVARALYRKHDAIAIEAAFADVYTGKQFATTVSFATDGGQTINATAGATYDTLLDGSSNFINSDVGTDLAEKFFIAITGDEDKSFKLETELMSGDFQRSTASATDGDGKLQRINGFNVKHFAADAPVPILDVNAGTRDCVLGTSRGICLGVSGELRIRISERPDKNHMKQVQACMFMGATRTEGKLVQKYQTTAT